MAIYQMYPYHDIIEPSRQMLGTLSAPFIANHPTHRIVHSFGFSSQNIFLSHLYRPYCFLLIPPITINPAIALYLFISPSQSLQLQDLFAIENIFAFTP